MNDKEIKHEDTQKEGVTMSPPLKETMNDLAEIIKNLSNPNGVYGDGFLHGMLYVYNSINKEKQLNVFSLRETLLKELRGQSETE